MDNGFLFSEVVRKLANLIRIGKVSEIKNNEVKVNIGRVTTGWLPIISTAGDTSCWIPISQGEQVIVFCPYGEAAQGFVLRSINYNKYTIPDDKESVQLTTSSNIKVVGNQKLTANTKNGFEFVTGNSNIKMSEGKIEIVSSGVHVNVSSDLINLSAGNSSIQLSSSGIALKCGASTIDVSSGNISLISGSITTSPPVCKCEGGI